MCVCAGVGVRVCVRELVCIFKQSLVLNHSCMCTLCLLLNRFSSFVKTGTETYVLGRVAIKAPVSATEKVKITVSPEGRHVLCLGCILYYRVHALIVVYIFRYIYTHVLIIAFTIICDTI